MACYHCYNEPCHCTSSASTSVIYPSLSYTYGGTYMKTYSNTFKTNRTPKIPQSIKAPMTVEQALDNLQKACNNVNANCEEITVLRTAGWEVRIDQAVSYDDRKGFQITLLEPKDKSK